jgi:hypothetical protein
MQYRRISFTEPVPIPTRSGLERMQTFDVASWEIESDGGIVKLAARTSGDPTA